MLQQKFNLCNLMGVFLHCLDPYMVIHTFTFYYENKILYAVSIVCYYVQEQKRKKSWS